MSLNFSDELYMRRCLDLARLGAGSVSPNPMVGCVIVHDGRIIGEGWHQKYGEPHAEVNAINSVIDNGLLRVSTLYVNLEPCSHWGKTPPCADLIIDCGIPRVVVGMVDPCPKVCGGGIDKMSAVGVEVTVGILETECRELNSRFVVYQTQQRPYVVLKWTQTADGFISAERPDLSHPVWMTNNICKMLVHRWRTEEDAIMVATNTALIDNPELTARLWHGQNPLRVIPDRRGRLPESLNVFDGSTPTLLFTQAGNQSRPTPRQNLDIAEIDFVQDAERQMLDAMYKRKIQSVIVEGGTMLLDNFIDKGLWDEAIVFLSTKTLAEIFPNPTGIRAPAIPAGITSRRRVEDIPIVWVKNRE